MANAFKLAGSWMEPVEILGDVRNKRLQGGLATQLSPAMNLPSRLYLVASLLTAFAISASADPIAFPTAEGFGAQATGGRGGDIYHVTTLADGGPGSFREAVSKGPRIVVFDVSGYIDLKSAISVASNITIAGQTAPGDGVSTRNYEVSLSKSHNIIVRYIHLRQGLTPKQEKKYALALDECSDIILDHVSIEWGRWDCIGMNHATNLTVQNCIIGPGVAPQRFGCLCEADNVTFSHNLWISNQSRNPKSKGIVQYINNVVYNWGVCGYVGGHSGADHEADLVGNYFIKGPSSGKTFAGEFKATDHIFQSGNYVDLAMDGTLNGRPAQPDDFGHGDSAPTFLTASSLKPPVPVTVDTAADAYKKVAAGAGCSLQRDAVDTALIADLTSLGKQGKTIEDPKEVGGFGDLKDGPAKINTSGSDIIPDAWKQAHATMGNNVEAFLNSLAGDPASMQ
jgi:pectate lyase